MAARFIEYLLEYKLNPDKIPLRNMLRPILAKKGLNPGYKTSAINELFRANLGKTEAEARKLVDDILDGTGLQAEEYEVFGRPQASGTYKSFRIPYNDHDYFITNSSSGKGLLRNKVLVPNKILQNVTDEFATAEDLVDAIDWDRVKSLEIQEIMQQCIESILDHDFTYEGVFIHDSFADMMHATTSEKTGKIIVKNSPRLTELVANAISQDVQNLSKDFGETLQPLIFLTR